MRTRRHALGQNFLHHKPTIEKIAQLVEKEMLQIQANSLLEVGPGKLALTKPLIEVARKLNIPLYLVERDRYLEEDILQGLQSEVPSELHFMDAATEKFAELIRSLKIKNHTPTFFASNLPYSASSQILANLCHCSTLIAGCVVMVQKEMALRIVAKPGTSDRGSLSLLIQSYFEAKCAFDVGPGAFTPPPKVTSTVVILRPLEKPLTAGLENPLDFERFCKMLFSQRRKMIRKLVPPQRLELFPKLGISGTERPEDLDLETIFKLYRGTLD